MSTHGRQLHLKPHSINTKDSTSGHASRMQMGIRWVGSWQSRHWHAGDARERLTSRTRGCTEPDGEVYLLCERTEAWTVEREIFRSALKRFKGPSRSWQWTDAQSKGRVECVCLSCPLEIMVMWLKEVGRAWQAKYIDRKRERDRLRRRSGIPLDKDPQVSEKV